MRLPVIYLVATLFLFSCQPNANPETDPDVVPAVSGIPAPISLPVTIVGTFPHDTGAYTQGLQFYKGKLWEGTGDYEHSALRITDPVSGKVEKNHPMGSADIFGEGITILNDTLYQLTWENHQVFVYHIQNPDKPIKTLSWPNQGWGITNNGQQLIISDGSANLYLVDPATFTILNTVAVRDHRGSVPYLNELEYVHGKIYANVYQTNDILQIDPESGHVTAVLSVPGLLKPTDIIPGRTDVLNGIAYDSSRQLFYVTGKRWPKLFSVKITE